MTILGSWGLTYSEMGQVTIVLWLLPCVIMLLLVAASTDGNGDAIPLQQRAWRKHILSLPLLSVFIQDVILRMPLIPYNWLSGSIFALVIYFSGLFIYKIMMALERRGTNKESIDAGISEVFEVPTGSTGSDIYQP